jgi:hypothetical protein
MEEREVIFEIETFEGVLTEDQKKQNSKGAEP